MLQAGRSRVRVSMTSLFFFNLPSPSSRTMALGLTQPQTEMSTRKCFWGEECGRRVRMKTSVTVPNFILSIIRKTYIIGFLKEQIK
jgi:hypothetical protein